MHAIILSTSIILFPMNRVPTLSLSHFLSMQYFLVFFSPDLQDFLFLVVDVDYGVCAHNKARANPQKSQNAAATKKNEKPTMTAAAF